MEKMKLKLVQGVTKFIDEFCEDCKLRGMTEESIRRYRSSLLIFANFLANKRINVDNIDTYQLREFLNYIKYVRKVKHKTVENYFSALSVLYDYLVFEG